MCVQVRVAIVLCSYHDHHTSSIHVSPTCSRVALRVWKTNTHTRDQLTSSSSSSSSSRTCRRSTNCLENKHVCLSSSSASSSSDLLAGFYTWPVSSGAHRLYHHHPSSSSSSSIIISSIISYYWASRLLFGKQTHIHKIIFIIITRHSSSYHSHGHSTKCLENKHVPQTVCNILTLREYCVRLGVGQYSSSIHVYATSNRVALNVWKTNIFPRLYIY